eukprot:TRINITY_DN16538_c0_g1_i1.p1 TRINITY_DN16538_c0_g1~~TRINITY_DN16538_c0_g1_i1.p1  ORF type:complete len:221 (-),score=15.02 TRINITY_DN16538_c0_g1_i1:222-884(-)
MTESPVEGCRSSRSMALEHGRAVEERESVILLLQEVLREMGTGGTKDGEGLLTRTRSALASKVPRFKRAVKDSSSDLVHWMRQGGPWRSFLVTVVGLITLAALTGLTVFTIFFLIATANLIIVSFIISVAAVGALVASFFISLAVIYVGAVSIAAFVISTITFLSIVCILFASGTVGVLWLMWQGVHRVFRMVSPILSDLFASHRTQNVPVDMKRYPPRK